MKLNKKYLNCLDIQSSNINFNCYINPNIINKPFANVNCITFNNLYLNIILCLYNEGILQDERILNFKGIFNDYESIKKDDNLYKAYKFAANSLYGDLSKASKGVNLVTEYLKYYYEDLLEINEEKILYYDVDTIYHIGDVILPDYEFPFQVEKIDYIIFFAKKQYTMIKDNKKVNYPKSKIYDDSVLKQFIRENKIQNIID